MDVAIALEESEAGRRGRLHVIVTEPMVAYREELCQNATRRPEVYLDAVVCITVEQLGSSVIASRYVSHASSWKWFALVGPFQRLVVIVELLRTAEVTDLQARLPSIVLSVSID